MLLRGTDKRRYTAEPGSTSTWYDPVTLERYLGAAFTRVVGPFVALGSPHDPLPPEGAARGYVADPDWQSRFLSLAGTAAAVVMEVSCSDNLAWELAAMRRRAWQTKLFVLTPPVPMGRSALSRRWYRASYWVVTANGRLYTGTPAPRWAAFMAQLVRAGYTVGPENPGPGAVVAFDDAGAACVIARGGTDPDDFTRAVRTYVRSRPH